MRTILATAVLLIIFHGYESLPDRRFVSSEQMYDCYFKLLCPLNALQELHERMLQADKWVQNWSFVQIKQTSGVKVSENKMEDWNRYRDIVCNNTDARNRKDFNEFFTLGGEKWMAVCQRPDSKECKDMSDAGDKIYDLYETHAKKGDCKLPGVAQHVRGGITYAAGRAGMSPL